MAHEPTCDYYETLVRVCVGIKLGEVLEVGTGWGISGCAFINSGCETLDTIDPNHDTAYGRLTVAELKDQNWRGNTIINLIHGRSENVLKEMVKEGKQYDTVFIDGSHMFEHVNVDIELCIELLKPGGHIILDDFFHRENFTEKPTYGVARASAIHFIKNRALFPKLEVYPTSTNAILIAQKI